jgi:hypothetical protein
MKKLFLLLIVCMVSMLAFAQPDNLHPNCGHCCPPCPRLSTVSTSQEIHPDSPPAYGSPSNPVAPTARFADLAQLEVLNLGLLVDGNIRIGILPQSKEVLVSDLRVDRVTVERVCTR